MATKVHHVTDVRGLNEALALLDVVKNADEYAKKLRELEKLRDQAMKGVDVKMTLEKAELELVEAGRSRETARVEGLKAAARAQELIDQAAADGARMRQAAEAEALELRDVARHESNRLVDEARRHCSEAERDVLELASKIEAAEAREASAAAAEKAAKDAKIQADAARIQYEQKLAALQGALRAAG